jgi:hypothetical protein
VLSPKSLFKWRHVLYALGPLLATYSFAKFHCGTDRTKQLVYVFVCLQDTRLVILIAETRLHKYYSPASGRLGKTISGFQSLSCQSVCKLFGAHKLQLITVDVRAVNIEVQIAPSSKKFVD